MRQQAISSEYFRMQFPHVAQNWSTQSDALTHSMPELPNLYGTMDRFHGRQFVHERQSEHDGSESNAREGAAVEVSLVCRELTSCCEAWFLTGCGPAKGHFEPFPTWPLAILFRKGDFLLNAPLAASACSFFGSLGSSATSSAFLAETYSGSTF